MKAIVVYESMWGNTAAIARAIAEGIGPEARALSTAGYHASTVSVRERAASVIVNIACPTGAGPGCSYFVVPAGITRAGAGAVSAPVSADAGAADFDEHASERVVDSANARSFRERCTPAR